MCTLSLITTDAGFRVVMNRDEERARPAGLAPRWHQLPDHGRAVWPVDPLSGGTWIGVSEPGVVLAVLNVNPEPRPTLAPGAGLSSRGSIIPALMAGPARSSAAAAISHLSEFELSQFAPFRLVALERSPAETVRALDARWDGSGLRITDRRLASACFASSGLGDACVAVRQPLFEALVAQEPTEAAQDAFHRHRWPDRPELSVLMTRAGARTVSITTVEVQPRSVTMRYEAIPEVQQQIREAGRRGARSPRRSGQN